MPDQLVKEHCPNCGSTNIDNYCSSCGQKIFANRFTFKAFFEVIGNALNFERGFIHTAIGLFQNPGTVINNYLKGKTKSYINPLNYILIITGIYAFLVLSLKIFDSSIEASNSIVQGNNSELTPDMLAYQQNIIEVIKKYLNFVPLLLIPLASLFSKWYYRKRKLYYGEHLILNTFIFAQNLIITIFISPLVLIIPQLLHIFPLLSIITTFIYFTYALRSIFRQSIVKAFGGTIVIYGGSSLFLILIMIIVTVITTILLMLSGVDVAGGL